MNINLTMIVPDGYPHYQCIREVIIYFDYFLTKMGFNVTISKNYFYEDKINILFLAFLLPPSTPIPKNTIIYNSEDLNKTTGWIFETEGGRNYINLLKRFPVIDYTETNLSKIENNKKVYLPLLYCEKLVTNLSRNDTNTFLFYGSLTESRRSILKEIKKHVRVVILTPAQSEYGFFRDKLIMQSKAIINLHKNKDVQYFESVRCFYPLINRIPVVSQDVDNLSDDRYRNAVIFLKRDQFVKEFLTLVSDYQNFKKQVDERLDYFRSLDGFNSFSSSIDKVLH
ncbi:hypothetical protein OAK51_00865 [Alphaproteobacteria bacterium]|nr:hypothetical protein [Alphaproteobacteria bacterium]